MGIWHVRLEELQNSPHLKDSMRRFVCSVACQIQGSCVLEPTELQKKVLNKFWDYHSHRKASEQWDEYLTKK